MVAAWPREAAARSTCGPTACLRRPRPAFWVVPNGPTRRHHARAARSPARPPASPACSMSRRAALPAPLSPRSRCSRRSFCTVPTPCITALIARTDSRLPAVAPRVCTHHHAACARAGPAKRLRLLASTCSSGEQLSGGVQVVPEPGGACARPLPRYFPCERRWQRPSPRPCGRPAAARPGARPTDAVPPQLCPNRRAPRSACPRAWFGSKWRGVGSCTRRPMVHIPSRPRLCCTPQSPYISSVSAWVEV